MTECIKVANMDILEAEQFYEDNFSFIDTPPLNDKFEMFGIDNMNFILNSGSYFMILIILFSLFLFRLLLN